MEGINNQSSEFMGRESITRLILKFAGPSILAMLSHSLYNVVDRMFVGRYVGTDGLAATSVCFPYMMFGIALSMLPNVGGSALISIALGRRDKIEAERVLGNAFFLAIAASFILNAVGLIFSEDIIRLSGGTESIERTAREYLDVIIWGVPFSTLAFSINGSIRAQGRPGYAMGALLLGAVCNIALDALFIVWFGWGIRGAAIATVISQIVSFFWVMGFFILKKGEIGIKLKYIYPNLSILSKIAMLGIAPFFTEISFSVFMLLFNRAISFYGGNLAMSALGIFMGWDSLLFLPALGIGEAVQPIFGYNYGAGLFSRVTEALKSAIVLACGYLLGSMFVVYFFAKYMVSMFTSDLVLIDIAVNGMTISYAGVVMMGIVIITGSYLQGLGRGKTLLFLTACRHFIFLIPTILILPRFLGLNGIWAAMPLVDFFGGLLSITMLLYLNKRGRFVNE